MGPDASRLGAPDQGRGSNVPAARDHRAGKVQAQTAGLGPAGQGRAGGAPAARARRRSLPRSGRGSLCKSGRTCPGSGLRSSGPPLHFLLLPALRSPLAQPRTAASATAAVTLAAHPHPSCKPSRAEPYRAPPRQRPSASEPGPASRGWGQQNPAPGPASGKGGACGVLPGGSPRGWAARANGREEKGRNSAERGPVRLEEDNESHAQPGSRPPGEQDGGRGAGPWFDCDGARGQRWARARPGGVGDGLGCPWVAEPGAWRDSASLLLLPAPRASCTELQWRAVKGSDFRKRCKRRF